METNQTTILEGNDLQNFFNDTQTEVKEEVVTETMTNFFSQQDDTLFDKKVETPVPEEVKIITPSFNYTDLVKEYIEDGEWEDVELELEEGAEPVILSELKEITPELFKSIRAAQKQLKDEKLKSNYISIEGLDETTKKLIDIKKKNGDITELLQIQAEFVNPLQGLDLDNEKVQEDLVRQKYSYQGIDADIIEMKIKKLKENVTLDLEAKKVAEEINSNYSKIVEQKATERQKEIEESQEEQKKFKKSMTEAFREFELKDSLVKNLVDYTAKFDETGLSEVDKMFFQAKSNPALFAKVAFMLSDEKAFNEFMGVKIKNKANVDAVKTILKINPRATNAAQTTANKSNPVQEFFQT